MRERYHLNEDLHFVLSRELWDTLLRFPWYMRSASHPFPFLPFLFFIPPGEAVAVFAGLGFLENRLGSPSVIPSASGH